MLVLTRKPGQSIHIGEGISIIVTSTKKGHVKLAIDAPREIPVLRSELPPLDGVDDGQIRESVDP